MKILLDNNNAAIANVINICCERINAEVLPYSNEINEYDLIIKNYEPGCDISEFDKTKTLFLVSKNLIDNFSSNLCLPKPFLPIDLVNFLTNYANKPQGEAESETEVSEVMGEKIAQDIQTISQIVKEIDDMPTQNQEKIQTGDIIAPSSNENANNVIDILDDDRPLDEILKELKNNKTLASNETEKKDEAKAEQILPSIATDEKNKMDDNVPLV
ncbi:MAG: hypothetical protein J6W17_02140, partial [Campylobacter sp.]|nr:hypothetical protein [Campylobacter sp.]